MEVESLWRFVSDVVARDAVAEKEEEEECDFGSDSVSSSIRCDCGSEN